MAEALHLGEGALREDAGEQLRGLPGAHLHGGGPDAALVRRHQRLPQARVLQLEGRVQRLVQPMVQQHQLQPPTAASPLALCTNAAQFFARRERDSSHIQPIRLI